MNTPISKSLVAGLVSVVFFSVFPHYSQADDGNEVIVNSHHVRVAFKNSVRVGENEFNLQLTDVHGQPVVVDTHVEVGIAVDNDLEEASQQAGIPDERSEEPNQPTEVVLTPIGTAGKYVGIIPFEASGDWILTVHFSVQGELHEVNFPIQVM